MDNLDLLQSFFGWASVVGVAILTVTSVILIGCKSWTFNIHKKASGLSEDKLNELYFSYLAHFKISVYIFFIVPYIAIWFMNR